MPPPPLPLLPLPLPPLLPLLPLVLILILILPCPLSSEEAGAAHATSTGAVYHVTARTEILPEARWGRVNACIFRAQPRSATDDSDIR